MAHQHAFGYYHARIDAADGVEAQQTVLRGGLDDEAYLIHMGRYAHMRLAGLGTLAGAYHVAGAINARVFRAAQALALL